MVICKAATPHPCAGRRVIKKLSSHLGWRPAPLAREAEKRKLAQRGRSEGHQKEPSDRVSKTDRECLCTYADKEGSPDSEAAPEERAAAFVSWEAELSREWVRQEPGRQLLERHFLVF